MSEILLKHSRLPRKHTRPPAARTLTVSKRPLSHLSAERRAEIAAQVLDRYIAGEQVAEMAHEYECSDVTIYALLLREHESDWKDIQEARALARLERAQYELRTAPDALSLAKSREEVRSAQWELERLCRRLYGEEKQQQVVVAPILNINVSGTETAAPLENLASHARLPVDVQSQQSTAALSVDDCVSSSVPNESKG